MNLAFCNADLVQSTPGPSEQNPWLSGGLRDISATSMLRILRLKSMGISLRNIGIQSARPSAIAFLWIAPTNNELALNIPEN